MVCKVIIKDLLVLTFPITLLVGAARIIPSGALIVGQVATHSHVGQ